MPNRIVEIAASGGDYTSFSAALAGESDFGVADEWGRGNNRRRGACIFRLRL
jgi:hypothetical protein